jgi:hypothetical protein
MLKRLADGFTVVGLLLLLVGAVTTTGSLVLLGTACIVVSIVFVVLRRSRSG